MIWFIQLSTRNHVEVVWFEIRVQREAAGGRQHREPIQQHASTQLLPSAVYYRYLESENKPAPESAYIIKHDPWCKSATTINMISLQYIILLGRCDWLRASHLPRTVSMVTNWRRCVDKYSTGKLH